ncbi:MAG: glycosyltransferase family 4 protein [Chloroflexota bacterium]|nr:glycosyltransferase family 4 protein [Chloroflexota bacterium]MDQ5866708.1 glycosyltransferase family 4 protein [Chloroflexota bacterium]
MRPRLCLFTDSIEPSGVGEHMLSLAEELRFRYDISFLGWSSTPLYARAAELGFPVHEITVDWYVNKDLLLRLKPDIVHVHAGASWEGHGGVWAASNAGVRCVLRTEHLPYLITEKWQQDEYTEFVSLADAVICVSEGVRRTYAQAGVPANKLRVARNGVRIDSRTAGSKAVADELRAALGLPTNAKLVLSVGRLTKQKGYEYLIGATCTVAARLPDTHFLLAGDGPLISELKANARACGALHNVHFLGSRTDAKELMRACDLFVLPSLFEGLPLVVLEAMAAGRAAVATRVCGTSEAVVDGVTGRLVPAEDPHALSEAIIEALTGPDLLTRWGEAGRERVERLFTAGRMADDVSAIYRELWVPATPSAHAGEPHDLHRHTENYQVAGITGA